jgi:hypothetical protein
MSTYGSFKEAKAALAKSIKKSKKGDKIRSFSRSDFNELLNAMLNDPKYEMETVQVVDGKLTNVKTPVVEDFRTKFIQPILTEFGVPKEDAGKIASDYRFKNSQTSVLYNFIADAVYQYIDADKKFNFPNRKDFCGSIYLKENDEAVVERDIRDIKDHKTITGHKKERRMKHKTIVKKSTCPTWQRHVL